MHRGKAKVGVRYCSLQGGGGVHGKGPQMAGIDQNELGDGSFESSVHGEEESRSPEA